VETLGRNRLGAIAHCREEAHRALSSYGAAGSGFLGYTKFERVVPKPGVLHDASYVLGCSHALRQSCIAITNREGGQMPRIDYVASLQLVLTER
jgi:hypothetical protein